MAYSLPPSDVQVRAFVMEAMHLVRRSASPIQLILMLCSIHWLAEGKRLESATSRLRLTSRSIVHKHWCDETRVFWSTAGGCDQSIDRLPLAVPLIDRFERLKTSFNEGRGGNPFIREVCVCITTRTNGVSQQVLFVRHDHGVVFLIFLAVALTT